MSRGRPRHRGSRRKAYNVRQREVRERHVRTAREETPPSFDDVSSDVAPAADEPTVAWTLPLQGRPAAA